MDVMGSYSHTPPAQEQPPADSVSASRLLRDAMLHPLCAVSVSLSLSLCCRITPKEGNSGEGIAIVSPRLIHR